MSSSNSRGGRNRDAPLMDRLDTFLSDYYREDILRLAQRYPNEQQSLEIAYDDVWRFDPDIVDDLHAQADELLDHFEEALGQFDLPIDVNLSNARVRITGLPDEQTYDVGQYQPNDVVNSLIGVRGQVTKRSKRQLRISEATFECQRCGTTNSVAQVTEQLQEPHECQGCERQGPFVLDDSRSEISDYQLVRLQTLPENAQGTTTDTIDITLSEDLVGEVRPGDRVSANSTIESSLVSDNKPILDLHGQAKSLDRLEADHEDIDIAPYRDEIESVAADDPYTQLINSIAPSHKGDELIKEALAYQLFGGVGTDLPDGSSKRGTCHILLIGDPGTGKSSLIRSVSQLVPRSVYASGKQSTSAGLTAAAVQSDFGGSGEWSLEAGALVESHGGLAAIDELDKMDCVTGDTLISLADGRYRKIEDIVADAADSGEAEELDNGRKIRGFDESVVTMDSCGRLVSGRVTAAHEYDSPSQLTAVSLSSGERLVSTTDHPYITFTDGERSETDASNLAEGDWVYVPRSTPGSSDEFDEPELGAVLGYLTGDGNIFLAGDGTPNGIRFTNKEEELLTDFERVCRTAFGKEPTRHPSEQRDDGVGAVRVHSRSVAREVLDTGMNLKTFDGKAFPDKLTAMSSGTKAAFVRALADSDGSVDPQTGNMNIVMTNYDVLLGVKQLLLEWGISCQIQERSPGGVRRDIYRLCITDAGSLRRYNLHIGFTLTRKQEALDTVCEDVSGDRTVLHVLPECGGLLKQARESLRLYQSECSLNDATYCNFETGEANISFTRARKVLQTFEDRQEEATRDAHGLETVGTWNQLEDYVSKYHISQADMAAELDCTQSSISRNWGDESLFGTIRARVTEIVAGAAETDLELIRDAVRGDVMWRQVGTATTKPTENFNGELPKLYDLTVENTHNYVANGIVVHNSDDQSGMLECMSEQQISISKAGINATLPASTTILAAANPEDGRFDTYSSIAGQVGLNPVLLSRFDLMFTLADSPDEDHDREIAEHMNTTARAGQQLAASGSVSDSLSESVTPTLDPDLVRAYVAHARTIMPELTDDAAELIEDEYVSMRMANGDDGDAPIPTTAREVEAVQRLAEASARIRLSDRVETEDVNRVIRVWRACLADLGMDPETGEFDADRFETGQTKTQRERNREVKEIIASLEDEAVHGAPHELVLETATDAGYSQSKVEHEIGKLMDQGDLYEPANDHYRTT